MRTIRRLATGLALLSVVPAAAAAQESRPFTDSWFWGAKGGAMTVRTGVESQASGLVGADWLITRSRAGLYVSLEQAFFDGVRGAVFDSSNTGGVREVRLQNFRRASFALVAFPGSFESVRPYAGIGAALNMVQRAKPVGEFNSIGAADEVLRRIEERRSRTAIVFMGGVQGPVRGVGLFAQATAMPTGREFLLNGDSNTYMLEAGVRFNMGSAIERLDR